MDNCLEITKTFGVGSSRYISCLPFSFKTSQDLRANIVHDSILEKEPLDKSYILTVPIGGGIVHWDIRSKKRLPSPNIYKQLHSDVITCLIRVKPIPPSHINNSDNITYWFNNYFHISSSYSGEIGIWDSEWNQVLKYQIPAFEKEISSSNKIMHISIDESYESFPIVRLAVSNEHGNCNISILQLDFSEYLNSYNDSSIQQKGSIKIKLENEFSNKLLFFGEMVDSNHFIAIQQDVGKEGFQESRTLKIGDKIINIYKFDCTTGEIVNELKEVRGSECILLVKNQEYYNGDGNKTIALSRNRTIEVLDFQDKQMKHVKSIQCEGSGLMRDLLFYQDMLLVPCSNSDLLLYSTSNEKLVSKWKSNNYGVVYSLKWSIPGRRLWVFDESGIHSIYLKQSSTGEDIKLIEEVNENDIENYTLLYHQITCCGIDSNEDGSLVACGDFLGNIMIWESNESHPDKPLKEYCFGIPIRSLSWGGGDESILIGLMDGSLMHWNLLKPINTNDSEGEPLNPSLISSLQDSITCIQWEKENTNNNIKESSTSSNKSIVAVGTTGGHLNIFKRIINKNTNREEFVLEWSCLAHQPSTGPQDLRFGSINKFAEIWSLTFHPTNNNIVATCSEDQTTIIWNRVTGEKVKTLTGHTTAVTCVDWQAIVKHNDVGNAFNILATCADDQTVRIWNTDDWKEILILNTNDIGEWHTVTYLSLVINENRNPLVVCATQNGWIFVWDSILGKKIYSKRTHLGSIEGLRWNKISNTLISCSSDCLIHVYKIE
ncbi:hypothetical protein DICPUDRAFT_97144 [Dictyostelium purpureum]|uniref:Uncharacterized protein n=1 Tax=Dictyostelium purpureum TaxID=5786 RepID=F0ZE51_DICPU|nr:uncharacterized protein DICPUDRAFT_97144 [Dictyostelium purpureum]EGC37763.1 hypothetical protein DICPUDRAFT_97144 [Dictyostelium purpureum]|eukprot:XP_003285702.1 hypothetical protein DICPUDRAFT_97144 [Dictyostelium purpureum]